MSDFDTVYRKIDKLSAAVTRTNTILEVTLPTLITEDEVDLKLSKQSSACKDAFLKNVPMPIRAANRSIISMARQFGPIILAMALGLMALGAYIGRNDSSGLEKQVLELSKKIAKAEQ